MFKKQYELGFTMRNDVNKNVDHLYSLQKDETEHQDHRLMWILTAQALIFTALCTILSNYGEVNEDCVILLIITIGVLISISGIYSMLVSRTAIGTVYEMWNKYNSLNEEKKRLPLHHVISLAPTHFLKSKINWLIFCHFAPNVFCAAWITLVFIYFSDYFSVYIGNNCCYLTPIFYFSFLILLICLTQFLGKYYLYKWGYDKFHNNREDKCPNPEKCIQQVDSSCLCVSDAKYHINRCVNNSNGVIQNSFNNLICSCHNPFKCKQFETLEQNRLSRILNHKSGDCNECQNLKIYHIVVDRFNGDFRLKKDEKGFFGGTIQGIIDRIDYIKGMGFNALLLTPVLKSDAYHGYHTVDYEMIDEHFGSWKDFDELVDALHRNGMKLLCDYVPNHCHINHPFFQSAMNDIDSPYRDWFYFDNSRKGGFISYQNLPDLPKFNLYNDATSDYLISIAIMFVKKGVDGLRIDHVIGVPFDFLVKLRKKVKEINSNFFLFGEAWFNSLNDLSQVEFISTRQKSRAYKGELMQEEIQLNYINYLDGVLDFRFRELLVEEVEKNTTNRSQLRMLGNKDLEMKIQSHFNNYPVDFQLILFLDNHDTNRFLFHCKEDRSLLQEGLTLCRFTFNKPFCIYYGTEKGMSNEMNIYNEPYGDEQVREHMIW